MEKHIMKALAEEAANLWLPIETAPEKEFILVYIPPGPRGSFLREIIEVSILPQYLGRLPTHWMPIPAKPKGVE